MTLVQNCVTREEESQKLFAVDRNLHTHTRELEKLMGEFLITIDVLVDSLD